MTFSAYLAIIIAVVAVGLYIWGQWERRGRHTAEAERDNYRANEAYQSHMKDVREEAEQRGRDNVKNAMDDFDNGDRFQ